ncbi:NAD(P)-dependent dehydrogenase, short-chain alcohol dehydrogenase family [bacterium A37T11]|nr:NAD(P)-dependent dehydrogenase, short-chain alcohol dehydrogenase family [bacterium A37T11]
MKSAIVTGANKGIGFEIVKQLVQNGFFVYLGSRDINNGVSAVEKLKAEGISNVEAIVLDVSNQASVDNARKVIGAKTSVLDVLINNAGISGEWEQSALLSTADHYLSVYNTNLLGVVRVTQAFIDLLKVAPEPRIVNVSTSMASLSLAANLDNSTFPKRYVIYQSSKSALNMYTVNLAFELKDTPFKVNAVCPGYTQTDFTGHQGTSTPLQAAQRIVKYALIDQDGPTGKFFSEEYFPEPETCPW